MMAYKPALQTYMCDVTVTYMFVLMLIFVFALLILDPTEYCPCIDGLIGMSL